MIEIIEEENKMNIRETLDRIAPESEAVDLSDLSTYAQGYLDAESKYLRMIEDGELVEVVRCKDCKYNLCPPERGNACCDNFYGMTDQMGFCHYGEKRTDETD